MLHLWTMEITCRDECYISGRWRLHIWTMTVKYLVECYISGRWRLHTWTIGVTYLGDDCYIYGRVLHIWTMGVTFLDERYISGRWRLHIWTSVTYLNDGGYVWNSVTYLNGNISARHTPITQICDTRPDKSPPSSRCVTYAINI